MAEAPDDANCSARLEAARKRRPCDVCNNTGEHSREVPVKGLVATTILRQKFPCPRCRGIEFSRYHCPVFAAWESKGRLEADFDAVVNMPAGHEQDRLLSLLARGEAEEVERRESWARFERERDERIGRYARALWAISDGARTPARTPPLPGP